MTRRTHKVAWRTTMHGLTSIVAAYTRGQARARTVESSRDAGYGGDMRDVRAVRAPEHDAWASETESRACWLEEYLPSPASYRLITYCGPIQLSKEMLKP